MLPRPQRRNPCRVSHRHGLASSDFARHYSRNHYCFLFLSVLRCFTSRRSLHTPYFIQVQVTGHNSSWVSPFGHPRINARLPTPQGISQAPTSFIGSRCQGIHHAPLPTCHTNHQHTQQTNPHPTGASPLAAHIEDPCVQNDQDTKRYTTLQTSHTAPPQPHPTTGQARADIQCVMLASTIQ